MKAIVLAIIALATPLAAATPPDLSPIVTAARFSGVLLIARGDRILLKRGYGDVARPSKRRAALESRVDQRWRWASVTKQIVATLVLQDVAAGKIALDAPVSRYLSDFTGPDRASLTVGQLLRHQSGLPNPDDSAPNAQGVPAYYTPGYAGNRSATRGYCAGATTTPPGGRVAYNNCDYIVAGALLEAVNRQDFATLVEQRVSRKLGLRSLAAFPGRSAETRAYQGRAGEPRYDFASFGAAGSLFGTITDLWRFDRALMNGKLLAERERGLLWDGKPELGYAALGQWVFPATLRDCARPVRLVERRGAIGTVQLRNFILPDQDMVVIAIADHEDFDFGEIWQGSGFGHDLLNRVLCEKGDMS